MRFLIYTAITAVVLYLIGLFISFDLLWAFATQDDRIGFLWVTLGLGCIVWLVREMP